MLKRFQITWMREHPNFQKRFPTAWISIGSLFIPTISGALIASFSEITFWLIIFTILISILWDKIFDVVEKIIIETHFEDEDLAWKRQKANLLFSVMQVFTNYRTLSIMELYETMGESIKEKIVAYLNLDSTKPLPISVSIYGYDIKSNKLRRVYGRSYFKVNGINSPEVSKSLLVSEELVQNRFYADVLKNTKSYKEKFCYDLKNKNDRKIFKK